MDGRVHLTRHVSLDELGGRYRSERNSRVKERLPTILHPYEGKMVKKVSEMVERSERTVERWLAEWN